MTYEEEAEYREYLELARQNTVAAAILRLSDVLVDLLNADRLKEIISAGIGEALDGLEVQPAEPDPNNIPSLTD
jgi:uncharacterized hydantoinase/oxoprolinase family protein